MVDETHEDTRQIGPRVPRVTADALEFTVREDNDGKYRGRLAERVKRDLRLGIGRWGVSNPEAVRKLRERGDDDVADEIEECMDLWRRVVESATGSCDNEELREEVEQMKDTVEQIADVSFGSFRILSQRERENEASQSDRKQMVPAGYSD